MCEGRNSVVIWNNLSLEGSDPGQALSSNQCSPSSLAVNSAGALKTSIQFILVALAFLSLPFLQVVLPLHLEKIRDRLAENIHELWGMNKIELGWTFGKVCASMASAGWIAILGRRVP